MIHNINQALAWARATLGAYADSRQDALRDSEILLQHTLAVNRAYLYTHGDNALTTAHLTEYQLHVAQRLEGIPIAYLLGKRDFWTLTVKVSPDTLIPRPETEQLVGLALAMLPHSSPVSLLDMGTGSGAIALALAKERPHWRITACDKHQAALDMAYSSAQALALEHIEFIQSDWFDRLEQRMFDAILANPPYLSTHDPHLQQGDLRFEPRSALVSGDNGLEALHCIIKHSCKHLYQQGILLLEHGYTQGPAVATLLADYGYTTIQCWQDHQGHNRISSGVLKMQ